MKQFLLATVALLCVAPCFADEPAMKADAAYGVRYAQERIVTLPQDQETPYLTVFVDPRDAKSMQIVKWFEDNKSLNSIKSQTHFNVIRTDSPNWDRYSHSVAQLPCVKLQAAGYEEPVAQFSGLEVPMSPDALAKGLNTRATESECFRRWRERRHQVDPQPDKEKDPTPAPLPPAPKPQPTPKQDTPWALLSVLAVLGGLCGLWKKLREEYRKLHGK